MIHSIIWVILEMNSLEEILEISFAQGVKITHATNSSKKVQKDSIFFGLPGTREHGSSYIKDAFKNGASIAVHNDADFKEDLDNVFYVKDLQENDPTNFKSKIYNFLSELYKTPSGFNPKYYGFTGTNGKSSAAFLSHQLNKEKSFNSLYIGTLGFQYNDKDLNNLLSSKTTPDIFELFEIFSECKFAIDYISIEISSHALDQGRLDDIKLSYAAILNLEEDHLDYHRNLDEYAKAKFKILKMTDGIIAIHNQVVKKYKNFLNSFVEDYKIIKVDKDDLLNDISYSVTNSDIDRTRFTITADYEIHFLTSIFPEFNICNLVFALLPLVNNQVFKKNVINDLSYLQLPKGRAQIIANIKANVIIDYAHNPQAIRLFLKSINRFYDNLIVVVGCGGNRDSSKRPLMLKAAIENSKEVIFTSDNSRNESFSEIFYDACKGNIIENVKDIENRKEAIIYGSKLISHNDCLVILGKGHEETQEINNDFIHFSDHEVIDEIYK